MLNPDQVAEQILEVWKKFLPSVKDFHHEEYFTKAVADALRTAVAEERTRLKRALVEAAIPLEALNRAETTHPIPLAPEMNESIAKALAVIRAALHSEPT